jgi:hypothetical protein
LKDKVSLVSVDDDILSGLLICQDCKNACDTAATLDAMSNGCIRIAQPTLELCCLCEISLVDPNCSASLIQHNGKCCSDCHTRYIRKIELYLITRSRLHGRDNLIMVKNIPNKGRGLMTSRFANKGNILIMEKPAVLESSRWNMVYSIFRRATTQVIHDFMKYYSRSGAALSESAWDMYDTKHCNEISQDFQVPMEFVAHVYDMVCTNIINAKRSTSKKMGERWGLYKRLSMVNHDCHPNCYLKVLNEETGLIALIANRDILSTEEVTYSYTDLTLWRVMTIEDEQLAQEAFNKLMKREHGFQCTCPILSDKMRHNLENNKPLYYNVY